MWKLIRKILLIVLCFLLLAIALLTAVNGVKSSPSEANLSLVQVPPNPYADQDNLFLARAGIEIPEMDNRLTEAKNRILQKTQWADDQAYGKLSPEQQAAGEPQFAVIRFVKSGDWCDPAKRTCLAEINGQYATIQTSKSANSVLLHRYLGLPQFKGAYDITPASVYSSYFSREFSDVRLLFLAHVGSGFLHGTEPERVQVLQQLANDLGVWKKSLSGHSSLIDKMIAVNFLHQSLALAGEIVNHPRFDAKRDGPVLEPALQDDAVPDFSGMWGYEYRFNHQVLKNITDQGLYSDSALFLEKNYAASSTAQKLAGKALFWFYDSVDTQNRSAEFFQKLMDASKLPPPQSLETQKALLTKVVDSSSTWNLFRNPVGKTLHSIATPDYSVYSQRIYDVFAYQKLVNLALQWRMQQLAPEARAARINADPTQAQHPASLTPFTYDSATNALRMKALHPRNDRRYEVVLSTSQQ